MALPTTLAKEMTALGFLAKGGSEARAITRFQRRALQDFRMLSSKAGMCVTPTFTGGISGKIDQATVDEVGVWTRNGYVAPLGIYKFTKVMGGGTLREDVALAWNDLITRISSLGATIEGPYGDTKRPLMTTTKIGASKYSFHIVGRAIDLKQELANPKGQRYYLVQEPSSGIMYWRIYCKAADQAGKLGTKFAKGDKTCYRFGDGASYKIPEGYYVDLTAEIELNGQFERIRSQDGWGASGSAYNKSEWWHFQWVPGKQATFQDECELVGISEKDLRDKGYADADLDHKPG